MLADQEVNEEIVESQWQHPTEADTTVLVDAVEGEAISAQAKAAQVRTAVAGETPGYEEVSFRAVSLGGREAVEWVFRESGRQKVDYFVNDCGVGYAILGSSFTLGLQAAQGEAPTRHRAAGQHRAGIPASGSLGTDVREHSTTTIALANRPARARRRDPLRVR